MAQAEVVKYGKGKCPSSKASIPFFVWIFRVMEAPTREEKTGSTRTQNGLG